MRPQLALALALAAAVLLAASAAAVAPTSPAQVAGPYTPITLPADARSAPGASPSPAPASPVRTTAQAALGEPGAAPIPTIPPRRQPAAQVGVTVKPTPRPKPRAVARTTARSTTRASTARASTGHSLRGLASWYCNNNASRAQISSCYSGHPDTAGFNAYAAAGPKLRAALGGGNRWRNRIVSVDGVAVKLVDWCQCYSGQRNEKLIDLYYDVFRRTGSSVTIRW